MTSIVVPGVPSSTKLPGKYLALLFGGVGKSAGSTPTRTLMTGNMIAADLTGSAPSFTVTAGIRQTSGTANENPIQVFSADDSATYFGRGSELHLGAKAYFDVNPNGILYQCPVAEGTTPTFASATLTFASGPANAGGTVRITIKGFSFEVGFLKDDTVTTVATAVARAINANGDLPVTAQNSAGVITITHKHGGPRGNNIRIRGAWLNGTLEVPIGTSATAGYGMTAAFSAVKLASGATSDSAANAIANSSGMDFQRFVGPFDDTTNIGRFKDELVLRSAATVMQWAQGIFGTVKSPSASQTDAGNLNNELLQLVDSENSESLTIEIAAQVCGSRLNGDALAGGKLVGEDTFPAANLNGLQLRSIGIAFSPADYPTQNEQESMLNNGVAPLAPSPSRPGKSMLVASYTTRFKGQNAGQFDFSVSETKVVTVGQYTARYIRDDLSNIYQGYNLIPDPPSGARTELPPHTVTPSSVLDRVKFLLYSLQKDGIIAQVDTFISELKAEIDSTNNQRLNLQIPFFPPPNLAIVTGILVQRA